MTTQEKSALNMATFIHGQSLFLLGKLNLDRAADICEQLHEDSEMPRKTLSMRLNELQDEG